jgi:hypothetical protein
MDTSMLNRRSLCYPSVMRGSPSKRISFPVPYDLDESCETVAKPIDEGLFQGRTPKCPALRDVRYER